MADEKNMLPPDSPLPVSPLSDSQDDELWTLCSAVCDGTIDPAGLARLEELVTADPTKRLFCAMYLRMNGQLMRMLRPIEGRGKASAEWLDADDACDEAPAYPRISSFGFLGGAAHATVAFFSQEAPFGFLVATIVLAVGLWIGSKITVSYNVPSDAHSSAHVEKTSNDAIPSAVAAAEQEKKSVRNVANGGKKTGRIVGRITGEVDCRWAMANSMASGERKLPVLNSGDGTRKKQGANAPRSPSLVCFGDKLAVASGLLEITYDTGARVILEGPCQFNVETSGGFLAVGRLTGRLEKTRRQGEKETGSVAGQTLSQTHELESPSFPISHSPSLASSNPQSLIPNPSPSTPTPTPTAFVIATPTAIVTDLGTEFGVEVDKSGRTETHVFRGEVVAAVAEKFGRATSQSVHLKAGDSTTIAMNAPNLTVYRIKPGTEKRFVRVMPAPPVVLFHETAAMPTYFLGWQKGDWHGAGWRLDGTRQFFVYGGFYPPGRAAIPAIATGGMNWAVLAGASGVRDFGFDMPVGAAFTIELDLGRTIGGESMGFSLCNAAERPRFEFTAEDGKFTYSIHDALGIAADAKTLPARDSKIPFTDRGLRLALQRTGVDSYRLVVLRLEDYNKYVLSGRFMTVKNGSDVRRLRVWNNTTDGALYLNEIRVVAPPTKKNKTN